MNTIRTYFKSEGRLVRVEIATVDPGIAQVEAYLFATEQKTIPETTVLAVINGGKAA